MIGYLGQEGSYSYFAASKVYEKKDLIPHNNIGRLFYALEVDEVEAVVIPFENRKDGTNLDALGRIVMSRYHISKEIVLDLRLNVISKHHDPSQINAIFATEDAINASYNSLKREFGRYKKNYVRTDKDALQRLRQSDILSAGAIVSSYEDITACNVVLANTRDSHHNEHKFVLVTKALGTSANHNRVLLSVSPKMHQVGALYDLLHELVLRGINLTKVISSPMYNQEKELHLYLELDGNLEDDTLKEALAMLRIKSDALTIIGSY